MWVGIGRNKILWNGEFFVGEGLSSQTINANTNVDVNDYNFSFFSRFLYPNRIVLNSNLSAFDTLIMNNQSLAIENKNTCPQSYTIPSERAFSSAGLYVYEYLKGTSGGGITIPSGESYGATIYLYGALFSIKSDEFSLVNQGTGNIAMKLYGINVNMNYTPSVYDSGNRTYECIGYSANINPNTSGTRNTSYAFFLQSLLGSSQKTYGFYDALTTSGQAYTFGGRVRVGGSVTAGYPQYALDVQGDVNVRTGGVYRIGGTAGFTGTGSYTNFTIQGGIITAAS